MVVNPSYARIPHPAGSRFRSRRQFYPFYLGKLEVGGGASEPVPPLRHPALPSPDPPPPCAPVHAAGEHANRTCRRLHVAGTSCALALAAAAAATRQPGLLLYTGLVGYGFAWLGHFFFEKNRPATFRYPLWSLACDFQLWWEVVSGARAF